MKTIMVSNYINVYPDHNEKFHIYTDASKYQLGAAIIQKGRPIAYWSKKLDDSQIKTYTTTEKELLSIVLCLNFKEY